MSECVPEYLKLFSSSTEEFEDAFDSILERESTALKSIRRKYADLDEEALSGIIA